jgi:hypothetical protein
VCRRHPWNLGPAAAKPCHDARHVHSVGTCREESGNAGFRGPDIDGLRPQVAGMGGGDHSAGQGRWIAVSRRAVAAWVRFPAAGVVRRQTTRNAPHAAARCRVAPLTRPNIQRLPSRPDRRNHRACPSRPRSPSPRCAPRAVNRRIETDPRTQLTGPPIARLADPVARRVSKRPFALSLVSGWRHPSRHKTAGTEHRAR